MANDKILIVEEDAGIWELIYLYLKNRNNQVIQAENGEKALEFLQSERPSLILLDIEMPEI